MFPMEIHLDQSVSYKMSEAAAIEIAVGVGVVLAIVDLGELQTSILMKIIAVEVLVGTEDLQRKKGNMCNEIQGTLAVSALHFHH